MQRAMIKITTSEGYVKPEYPKLMMAFDTKCIVLFESLGTGTCIDPGQTDNPIGFSTKSWATMSFKDYNEPVTLTNG
jgi:hypothetical protein